MIIYGEISIFENKGERYLQIDAKPHIMTILRPIFNNPAWGRKGEFTHKTIIIPSTNNNKKNIQWILTRYPMRGTKEVMRLINEGASDYDKLRESIEKQSYNKALSVTKGDLVTTTPPREYQVVFDNLRITTKRILNADKMGLGKTLQAILALRNERNRPALWVCPPTLCLQAQRMILKELPGLKSYIAYGYTSKDIPIDTDVVITSYNRMDKWQDTLVPFGFKTLIGDEIHELRNVGTQMRSATRAVSLTVETCIGLSGTPVANWGNDIWSVLDVIYPDCLGSRSSFMDEWTDSSGKVKDPLALHSFLKDEGLMVRRTPEEVGLDFGEINKIKIQVESDEKEIKKDREVAKKLALGIVSGVVGQSNDQEFDWKLRKLTGKIKAKSVAELAKMILSEEKKVIIGAWHRDVWEILERELKDYYPVYFTGTESPSQKDKNLEEFKHGRSRVLFISLGSGAGIDGLQEVCNTIIHAEFAWNGKIHDQLNHRIERDGKVGFKNAYYPYVNDLADPVMIDTIAAKEDQSRAIVDGIEIDIDFMSDNGADKDIKAMATKYLESIGEEIPEVIEEKGLLGEVANLLRSLYLTTNDEDAMQRTINEAFISKLVGCTFEREYQISKRSRVDFCVSSEDEKIFIECKIKSNNKQSVYRQVRRYIQEGGAHAVILVAPWTGIQSFVIDEVPVVVISPSLNKI